MQASLDMKKHPIAAAIIFVCMAILFIIGYGRYVHSKDGKGLSKTELRLKTNFIAFSKIDKAHIYSRRGLGSIYQLNTTQYLFFPLLTANPPFSIFPPQPLAWEKKPLPPSKFLLQTPPLPDENRLVLVVAVPGVPKLAKRRFIIRKVALPYRYISDAFLIDR